MGRGLSEDVAQERVAPRFGAQGAVHLACVAELVVGILHVVDGESVVVDAVGLGDDGVDERAEAECLLPVAELQPGV